MLKIQSLHPHAINTASLHNRQTIARHELHDNYLKKLDVIQKVNETHLKYKKEISLINAYDNLNRHIQYGSTAYSVYVGNSIDAFI
jgi:alpha-glucuronidase